MSEFKIRRIFFVRHRSQEKTNTHTLYSFSQPFIPCINLFLSARLFVGCSYESTNNWLRNQRSHSHTQNSCKCAFSLSLSPGVCMNCKFSWLYSVHAQIIEINYLFRLTWHDLFVSFMFLIFSLCPSLFHCLCLFLHSFFLLPLLLFEDYHTTCCTMACGRMDWSDIMILTRKTVICHMIHLFALLHYIHITRTYICITFKQIYQHHFYGQNSVSLFLSLFYWNVNTVVNRTYYNILHRKYDSCYRGSTSYETGFPFKFTSIVSAVDLISFNR